jgi:WD40 repeat protein
MKKTRTAALFANVALLLVACGSNEPTPQPGLEPTRTPSARTGTVAPRPTKVPTVTVAPKATAKPLAANAITIDNAAKLKTVVTRAEATVTQIYAASARAIVGVSGRTFELIDADTLEVKATTRFELKLLDTQPVFWFTGSPDATTGATMEGDGTVTFYDLARGTTTKSLKLDAPKRTTQADIALNEDGTQLVYANGIDGVQRFEVATGDVLGKPQEMPAETARVIFSENASKLAAVQADGSVVVIDTRARNAKKPLTLTPGFSATNQVYFSPDGAWMGVDNGLTELLVWNLNARNPTEPVHKFKIDGPAFPVFDAAGEQVAILNNGVTTVYRLDSGERVKELALSGGAAPTSAHFSSDGQSIFVASASVLESFRVQSAELLQTSRKLAFTRMLFTPNGKQILTWGILNPSSELGVVEAATGKIVDRLQHAAPVRFVMQSARGNLVAAVTQDGSTHVWNMRDRSEVFTLIGGADSQRRGMLCFTPDESGLVTVSAGEIVIEPINKDTQKRRFQLPENINNLAACGNQKGWIAAVREKDIDVIDLGNKAIAKLTIPAEGNDLQEAAIYAFSDDGETLAAVSARALYIWHIAAERLVHRVELQWPPAFGFEFSPNGQWIGVSSGDAVGIVDVATGQLQLLAIPQKPKGRWVNLMFTDNPDVVITASMVSDEGTAQDPVQQRNYRTGELAVWSTHSGNLIHQIETDEPLYAAVANSGGTLVATGTRDNVLVVWGVK